MNLSGHTALITGASSGLGRAFARLLASMGSNLYITARRKDLLEKLALDLTSLYPVQVEAIPLDLSKPGAYTKLFQHTDGSGHPIDILINNAGFATFSTFSEIPLDRIKKEIRLNVLATTELSWHFVRAMKERNRGYLLNVSSLTSYLPTPGYATYSAGKAYVRSFTEALAYELKKTRVRVMSLCPGGVATDFWEVAGHKKLPFIIKANLANPERVAWAGLTALFCGRHNLVTGFVNKLAVLLFRFFPERFLAWACSRILKLPS